MQCHDRHVFTALTKSLQCSVNVLPSIIDKSTFNNFKRVFISQKKMKMQVKLNTKFTRTIRDYMLILKIQWGKLI